MPSRETHPPTSGPAARSGDGAPTEVADLEAVAEREDAFYRALEASDADAFEELLSADATDIHWSSVAETRDEFVAGQRHGLFKHGPTVIVERGTRLLGDAAVTRGIVDILDTGHGEPVRLRLRQTLLWVREDGAWKLLVRQATRIPL